MCRIDTVHHKILLTKGYIIKKSIKNSILVTGAAAAVGLSGIAGVGAVSAQNDTGDNNGIVGKIASTFNLNQDEVKKVFDENRQEHQAEREAKRGEKLQKLVDEGSLTAEQKTALEAKFAEQKAEREANRDANKDLTKEQRKAKHEENKAAFEAWAKEQGIDLSKLGGGMKGERGPERRGGPRD